MEEKMIIPDEVVANKIYLIRNNKVMIDSDLAELYGVETRVLNQQVKRNVDRFPSDFMFQLTKNEWGNLKLQNVTSNWGGRRKLPYVFTEHGVLMLSNVLNSKKAILVSIQIMRIFTKLRELFLTQKDLLLKMEQMEKQVAGQDDRIDQIFSYLKKFINNHKTPRTKIGFKK